jgi:hypothetical protein
MPKIQIDYTNVIIYKIVSKDLTITEIYVGHTTNFIQRKYAHKNCCINKNVKGYNFKIYQFIRDNGGWDNFEMIEIEKYPCKDGNEATARERYWYETLNATLNVLVPNRSSQDYYTENKENIIQKVKENYTKNKEKNKEKMKEYYTKNKEGQIQQSKEWNKNNKERRREINQKYYQKKKEKTQNKCV